jgi:hypothetical protein
MKLLNKLAVYAALAVLALGSCDTGLSPANPDFAGINKSYSANGISTNKIGWSTLPPNSVIPVIAVHGGSGLKAGGNDKNTIVTVTFPAITGKELRWDALAGNPGNAALATKMKAFLSFFNVGKNNPAGAANTLSAPVDYTVVRREENKVYLNLALTDTNAGNLYWKLEAARYTYNGGNTFDQDENGVPGEPFYDDYYHPSPLTVRDTSGSSASTTYKAPGDGAPQFPEVTGADIALTVEQKVWPNHKIEAVVSGGVNPAEDYAAAIGSHVRLEKYNLSTRAYEQVSLTWAAEGAAGAYSAAFAAEHEGAYRIRAKTGIVSTMEYKGGKQRVSLSVSGPLFAGGSPFNAKTKGWQTLGVQQITDSSAPSIEQNAGDQFWLSARKVAGSGGLYGSLVFTLDASKTGNQGLNTPTKDSIKLGYFAGTEDESEVVLIPTKSISLRYSNPQEEKGTLQAGTTYYPDELVIELADTVKVEYLPPIPKKLYLFISKDYGYRGDASGAGTKKAGTFGDRANFKWPVNGEYFFGKYGSNGITFTP